MSTPIDSSQFEEFSDLKSALYSYPAGRSSDGGVWVLWRPGIDPKAEREGFRRRLFVRMARAQLTTASAVWWFFYWFCIVSGVVLWFSQPSTASFLEKITSFRGIMAIVLVFVIAGVFTIPASECSHPYTKEMEESAWRERLRTIARFGPTKMGTSKYGGASALQPVTEIIETLRQIQNSSVVKQGWGPGGLLEQAHELAWEGVSAGSETKARAEEVLVILCAISEKLNAMEGRLYRDKGEVLLAQIDAMKEFFDNL